ncbi:hypothetical protein LT493_09025 [Streptomyces tricolor]|nr:hypothetical protein [Streptomyces tricolor]
MCGIAGWVDFARPVDHDIARAMTDTMARRGPDAEGVWTDGHAALGHRRLSVIDLEGGCQPMAADEGPGARAVLTYSGETYNFQELRTQLTGLGHRFTTRSDTEVVLRAYLEWGPSFVDRLEGIYAFAIWDRDRDELLLVRDRMGVKPLYYAPTASGVLFGSRNPRRSSPTRVPARPRRRRAAGHPVRGQGARPRRLPRHARGPGRLPGPRAPLRPRRGALLAAPGRRAHRLPGRHRPHGPRPPRRHRGTADGLRRTAVHPALRRPRLQLADRARRAHRPHQGPGPHPLLLGQRPRPGRHRGPRRQRGPHLRPPARRTRRLRPQRTPR